MSKSNTFNQSQKSNKWFLGLDIGTNSVGWAATDTEYNLLKFHGDATWGIYLFDEAKTAAERRANRVSRRRLQRKKQRIDLLQEFFAEAISQKDESFFIRLKESGLWAEDRTTDNEIFTGLMTNKEYGRKYPTIHHLICDLMNDASYHDPRLVYIACSYILSHRGHFLLEVDEKNVDAITDFSSVYDEFMSWFLSANLDIPWQCSVESFADVMRNRTSTTAKEKNLFGLLFDGRKPQDCYENLSTKVLIGFICGRKTKLADLFLNPEYSQLEINSISISSSSFDEDIDALSSYLTDEEFDLIAKVKKINDWSVLVDILKSEKYISKAKVNTYEQHKADLAFLKRFVKKYLRDSYDAIFNDIGSSANYAAYSYNSKILKGKNLPSDYKMCSAEEFCKFIKKYVGAVSDRIDEEDRSAYEDMIKRIDLNEFCPKQVTGDNRVIPYQLYLVELRKILDNASQYLDFLNKQDDYGTIKDKIISLMTFRIPYYVGPLNRHSQFSWIEKKSEEKIFPWNFDSVVDKDKSEENFIRRMTNKCSYLAGEDVLPKNSLLYSKFMVLNEINNIRVDGIKISVAAKRGLYESKFMTKRRVTVKDIKAYFINNGYMNKDSELTGIDVTVKSSLNSYHDFKSYIKSGMLSERQIETIINRITLTTDRRRLYDWLQTNFNMSADDAKRICRFKYSDFGRLSERMLTQIFDLDTDTGAIRNDHRNIIQMMWDTNENFMMLMSNEYGFRSHIEKENKEYYSDKSLSLDEQLKDMYISNAVKRPILRTLEIVDEMTKIRGSAPEKVFIEMARGATEAQRYKRTKSRREQIKEFYENFGESEVKELMAELDMKSDDQLRSDKLFLYFTQLGRCMYSGESIVINDIGNSKEYDIDHIWPQSKIKDDSLDNTVLVKTKYNAIKGDQYPVLEDWRNDQYSFWHSLHEKKLISDKKFERLKRSTRFTEEELASFINRQLVETRQSTKAVAEILKEKFNTEGTEIVFVKAGLASEFRNTYKYAPYFALKCREVNDFHHARDAYLNIVVGNIYNVKFTSNPMNFIQSGEVYTMNLNKMLEHDVKRGSKIAWISKDDEWFKRVIATIHKNNVKFVRYSSCQKGALFDLMPLRKGNGQVARKAYLADIDKYGGYNKAANSHFYLIKYDDKKSRETAFVSVPLMYADSLKTIGDIERYCKGEGYSNPEVLLNGRRIKYNTLLEIDGYRASLSGKASGNLWFKGAMQLTVSPEEEYSLKRIVKYYDKTKGKTELPSITVYDEVSEERNIQLYDMFTYKINNTKYKTLMSTAAQTLIDGRETFRELDVGHQCIALYHIMELFGCGNSQGKDLTLIGGKKSSGIQTMGIKLNKKRFKSIYIIDQSPTGLFEKRSPNLLEL